MHNWLFASVKTLTNCKDYYKDASEVLLRISFSVIGQFSPVYSIISIHVTTGFQNYFQDQRWLLEKFLRHGRLTEKAGTIFLNRVSVRVFRISKCKTLFLIFSTERQLKIVKTIIAHKESTD